MYGYRKFVKAFAGIVRVPLTVTLFCLVLPRASTAAVQIDDVGMARRIAAIATVALAEYAEGVVDGRVVQLAEWDEARLFMDEARRFAEQLPPAVETQIVPILERLLVGVAELHTVSELRQELAKLRRTLEAAVDVPLDPMPQGPPSLARGETLFTQYCAGCHGDAGAGDGTLADELEPPPTDLTDQARLATASPLDFFRTVTVGVAGTAMPAFADQLALDDRWAVALYAATLRFPLRYQARGREAVRQHCPDCRLLLSDFEATVGLSDDSLAAVLASHIGSTRRDTSFRAIVAYGRAAAALEELGGNKVLEAERTVASAQTAAREALELAQAADRQAAVRRALDAYLIFERVESMIRARNPQAARRVETAFADYRAALQSGGAAARWVHAEREVDAALDATLAGLRVRTSPTVLFGQSVVILLREGLEAILIIGVLTAILSKAGVPERKRDVGLGVLAASVASVLTALGFATILRSATAHRELVEGLTMLLATAVLFWVSFWLVSKIEIRKWQAFVRAQTHAALSSKRALALAAVAFLAVYREGFETVLFYAALFTTSDRTATAFSAIFGGIAVAAAVLAIVYLGMQRYGLRLPLKPFFGVTSAFLYLMAFTFAGQGVAELQEAGMISATPLGWLPQVPVLGIFPTAQTFLSQLALALAFFGALFWVFWLEPKMAEARMSM